MQGDASRGYGAIIGEPSMNFPVLATSESWPIALTLSQYAEFVWYFLENENCERLLEQKMREEIIATPFSLHPNEDREDASEIIG